MKKVITFILTAVLVCCLTITVHAESANVTDPEVSDVFVETNDQDAGTVNTVIPDAGGGVNVDTVLTRVKEWWDEYSAIIESVVGFLVISIAGVFAKKIKSGVSDILGKILTAKGSVDAQSQKTDALINGYNGQIDVITGLQNETAELRQKIGETCIKAEEALKAIVCIGHMLSTVYINNAALPQGTRDIVNVDYAQIMKLVNHVADDLNIEPEVTANETLAEE